MKLVEERTQIEKNSKLTVEKNEFNYHNYFKELLGKPTILTSNDESLVTIQN